MWFHLASVLLFWVVVKDIGRVGIVRLSNRESVGAGAGSEGKMGRNKEGSVKVSNAAFSWNFCFLLT